MLTEESFVEWAAGWVSDEPVGQRQRFAECLRNEIEQHRAANIAEGRRVGIEEAARALHEHADHHRGHNADMALTVEACGKAVLTLLAKPAVTERVTPEVK